MAGSIEESRSWIRRAEQTVRAASSLLADGYYRDAVSRAYYAMFYAAKAAVLTEGVEANKHSAVIAAFGRLFAKTGRLPYELHRTLAGAFDARQTADYSVTRDITQKEAERRVAEAEQFVKAVETSLSLE
ncbi:MAG: HEPN domain-containing protein [Chloroflexota bacterium]